MWSSRATALFILSATTLASAQYEATKWCDEGQTGVCFQRYHDPEQDIGWGYLFPESNPDGSPPTEFIGIYTAPTSVGWIGNSVAGPMRFSPLIIGWINDKFGAVVSVRVTEEYNPPKVWTDGPTVTLLGGSGVDASGHQRIIWRCEDCTAWESGGPQSINLNGTAPVGFAAHGSIKPLEPANPDSPLYMHSMQGIHRLEVPEAKSADYWNILKKLQDTPQLPPPNEPTTTTTPGPGPTTGPSCRGAPASLYPMVVADGWEATTIVGRLLRPRAIILDTRGNLLALEDGRGVSVHTLDDDGCVTSSKLLINDPNLNHGLDVHPNGRKIIVSSPYFAWSYDYDPVELTAYNRKTLVYGMYNPGHLTRSIWISRKYPDYVMISVGSLGNVDLPSFEKGSGRAQVRVFDMRTLPPNGIPYTSGGIMGYGLRNDVGIHEDRNGLIYSIENSLDGAYRTINGVTTDIHNDNPAEKVYRLGDPRNPTDLFGGYPHCYSVWKGEDFTDSVKGPGDWFVQEPNSTMNDAWCEANAVKPIVLLPAHNAPLDLKFSPRVNDGNLYATLHGSSARDVSQGYKVITIPGSYSNTGVWSPSTDLAGTTSSTKVILGNEDETRCKAGCFRPCSLAFGKDGDWLFVSSDASGEIFLLKRPRDPTSPPVPTTTFTTTTTTTNGGTPTTAPSGPQQSAWGQCGGRGYAGPTVCPPGQVCSYVNSAFSQCVNA